MLPVKSVTTAKAIIDGCSASIPFVRESSKFSMYEVSEDGSHKMLSDSSCPLPAVLDWSPDLIEKALVQPQTRCGFVLKE